MIELDAILPHEAFGCSIPGENIYDAGVYHSKLR
jgi:hypothetical protein